MILIVVRFPVKREHADEWPTIVAEFSDATRAEPGNAFFEWSRSVDDANLYVLVEGFRDADAGAAHVNTAHFKRAIAQMPQYLTGTPEIINVEVAGDGFGPMAEMTVE
jgi:quinol monooxygenase YgiN